MSETQSGSKRQGTSRQGTSQVTRSSHGRTAKICRTRELIERVEVEHEAEGGEPPVITTAEQRVFNATEMERGKPGEITSRKQPGRGAKKTSEREISIQAATAPDAAAGAGAEQGVPPLMSTQDYLEEAEELLAHPLDPTDLQTQPEAPSAEEEDGLAGDLAEQAPEDAAAAGERLAAHMEPGAGAERESSTQPSADAGAPVSEGGLVGRVAQVGRRIVRSLLHPDGQGAGAEATAADGGAAAADAGDAGKGGAEAHGYHVEEPDQDPGSPESPEDTPPQARVGARQAKPIKRSPASAKKLKPYTPVNMAAVRGTPSEVQPVEDVLTQPDEEQPVEDAAPAPRTPPPKRGRPAAPKTPSTSKGKADAHPTPQKEPAAAQSVGEAGRAPDSSPKRGRGRPSKAAAKTAAPTKRTRAESSAGKAEAEGSRKAQKTEPMPAARPKSPQAGQGQAAGKGTSKKAMGPQKKAVRKPGSRRKERPDSFKIYIHRVLKEVHPDLSLSNKAIGVLDGFTKDLRERITLEASQLCRVHSKATLSSREIDAAIRLLLPGELFSHAVSEGRKAVTRALT